MTTPSREEIDALWAQVREQGESIERLQQEMEARTLSLAKRFADDWVDLLSGLVPAIHRAAGQEALSKRLSKYIEAKVDTTRRDIADAYDIETVFEVVSKFLQDIASFKKAVT